MALNTLGQPNPSRSLLVFDFFEIDRNLPKHQKAKARDERMKSINVTNSMQGLPGFDGDDQSDNDDETAEAGAITWSPRFAINSTNSIKSMSGKITPPPTAWAKFLAYFKPKPVPVVPEPETSVIEVFARIKASKDELAEWDMRNTALDNAITMARTAGQTDMLKKLEAEKGVRKFENMLYAKGHRKYLTEAQLLEFVVKCEKGLCLDWVKNFVRPIPDEVVLTKAACDEAHLFDNYVILHYDPKNKATTAEARAKEKAKREDPILFGMIQGSRKLYFVGDWIDAECDLTFAEIVQKLGVPLTMDETDTKLPS